MQKVVFDEDRCKGCELCVGACPVNIIYLGENLNAMGYHPAQVHEQGKCISCGFCARMCPDVAITVWKEGAR